MLSEGRLRRDPPRDLAAFDAAEDGMFAAWCGNVLHCVPLLGFEN